MRMLLEVPPRPRRLRWSQFTLSVDLTLHEAIVFDESNPAPPNPVASESHSIVPVRMTPFYHLHDSCLILEMSTRGMLNQDRSWPTNSLETDLRNARVSTIHCSEID
jgi:hypothetical protein